MSIERQRPGGYVELLVKARARVVAKTGRVLVPYQAEWGAPNQAVDMADTSERLEGIGAACGCVGAGRRIWSDCRRVPGHKRGRKDCCCDRG